MTYLRREFVFTRRLGWPWLCTFTALRAVLRLIHGELDGRFLAEPLSALTRSETAEVPSAVSGSGGNVTVAIFQLEVPEKYLTDLASQGQASFLTALALAGEQKIIEVNILVLRSKEFLYTETAIDPAAPEGADPGAIKLPWIERK